ncbi:hypothetical protein Y1Q_0010037 [Alligator mississippiensis]|uniref:Uncharacterized protein n=1 Tax=Alligator mississippiensis TaxID=8496 RepID=A0A151MSG8_ALLMI|nr:hypothetical protein Y1Q_0010037 [Alligator mississippiensis]
MSTGQDDSNQSVGGGACKAELSYQKLQVVRKEYLESLTEIHEPELINIACTMEKYKQVKDNCDTVGEMLSKGRDCLEMLKQQWENVVCFFEMIEFCLSQIKKDLHFVGNIPQITKSDPNLWIYIRALLMTFRVHLLCETYVQVHRQCLMSLDKIPEKVLTGKIPIKDAKKKCEDAQEAIEKLVLEKKKTIDEELNDRM